MGSDARINSSRFANVIGGDTRSSISVQKEAILTIGDNLRMSNSAISCAYDINLGKNVLIKY